MLTMAVRQSIVRVVLAGSAVLLLSACDYWPPALQAQIEQLKKEAEQAAAERASLEEQLNTANKVRNDLQMRVDEVAKAYEQLAARATMLEQDLATEHKRAARVAEHPKPPAGKTAKAPAKTTKKKPATGKAVKPSAHH